IQTRRQHQCEKSVLSVSNLPEVAGVYLRHGNCRPIKPFTSGILIVDRCPESTTDSWLIRQCHSTHGNPYRHPNCVIEIDQIPVQDSRGVVYRNIYCAICHDAKNASTWSTEIETDTMTYFDTDESRNILIISNEPSRSPNCSQKNIPAQMDKIVFCDTSNVVEIGHSHRGRSSVGDDPHTKTSVFPLSFQVLMNFGINGKGHIFFSATSHSGPSPPVHRCAENEVYDQNTEQCKKIVCASGYKLVNSKCQSTTATSHGDSSSLDDLDTLNQDEETSQITLRLNVSGEDLLLLQQENSDKTIVAEFSARLNISSDRIKNFTIEFQNGTVSGKEVEVVRVVTPTPPRTNKALPKNLNQGPFNSDDENVKPENTTEGTETDSVLTDSNIPYDTIQETYTVIIKFILFPAKKKSSKDVPTSLVLDTLKTMIDGKSFSFSLNGTSFNVDDVDKDDPLILDSWCTKGRINYYMGDEFEFTSRYDNETGQMQSCIYVNSTNSYYDQKLFDLFVMLTTTLGEVSNTNTSSYVFVCDMPRIVDKECGRIEIVDSEYIRYPENNSIFYSGELLSMNNYEYINDSENSLRLCIPKSYSSDTEPDNLLVQSCGVNFYRVSLAENYLSFILGIISLVAMVSVLVTYYLFDNLRNLPGLNTINLTVSLFMGELLFLLSGLTVKLESDWPCKAIAVFLHYLFLASFFWMNVMAYDLYRTFGHNCILTRVREKKNFFCRYFVYAWGSPALIVCACAVIDFSEIVDGVHIGYGSYVTKDTDVTDAGTVFSTPSTNWSGEHNGSVPIKSPVAHSSIITEANLGCWIMEPVATLITFGFPMIIILVVNAIMFIKTIICIRAVAKLAKLKTRRSSLNQAVGKSDVVLYVRMSTVMGFTWIIGLGSSVISAFADGPTDTMCVVLHTIGILFILFNCSQGVFIFGAFVFNKRVLGLYKSKIKAWRETDRRKTYFRSTSTLSSSVKY
ncbi:uncharacterized protein LOC117344796, partial [Pecten maximus]|uniref:uncharacterized protein LOC117344796 n=1 Tax=Pecten maximus TaxID=6579 RepID=UPI0014585719